MKAIRVFSGLSLTVLVGLGATVVTGFCARLAYEFFLVGWRSV